MFKQANAKKRERGVSAFLSVLILALLLAVALGISAILVNQLRMIKSMVDSVQAFFAADTGIERALTEEQSVSGVLSNGASYEVQFLPPGANCQTPYYCLKSLGIFRSTRRAIEIKR